MSAITPLVEPQPQPQPQSQSGPKPWPSRRAAYYALAVIILATMLNFFDAQVFGMMAQRIKVDLHLSDEQLGFLIGPANIIFYVVVGIPMARLVDIYSAQYRAGVRNRRHRRHHRARRPGAELLATVLQPHAGGCRRLGACTGRLFDAGRLLPAGTAAARHRHTATGIHRRQFTRDISGRAPHQLGGRVADQPLDGA